MGILKWVGYLLWMWFGMIIIMRGLDYFFHSYGPFRYAAPYIFYLFPFFAGKHFLLYILYPIAAGFFTWLGGKLTGDD
ncbi:hypothetical protein K8I28_13565 [bacterium]|nr:hypothetical protein [bacterium]